VRSSRPAGGRCCVGRPSCVGGTIASLAGISAVARRGDRTPGCGQIHSATCRPRAGPDCPRGNASRLDSAVRHLVVGILLYLVVEVAAIWAVGSLVGALWTIVLLVGGALLGSWLARREGGKAMRAVMAAARDGRSGHQEVTDGMLVALGGVL